MRALIPCLVLLAGLTLPCGSTGAADPPRCTGRDLADEVRQELPEAWARILKAARSTANADAVFWRIEGPAGPPSFLLGTIHLSDDRINALPASVDKALDSVRQVALEVADLSPQGLGVAFGRLQDLLVFGDGRSLNALLSRDEQRLARGALEKAGMPGAAVAALKPWVVTMLLALTDCERRRVAAGLEPMDARIGARARGRGIPVLGLETLEDQLRAFAAVPDDDQLIALRAGLKLHDRADDMVETMVRRYLERQIGIIWPLQEAVWQRAGFSPAAFVSFQRELVTVRNRRMRDAALPLLAAGGVLIAVGALHLPGEDGLVELLRAAGYKVEKAE